VWAWALLGLRDTASAAQNTVWKWRIVPPLPRQEAGRRGRFEGRTTPAKPSRRGSRDSGQTANTALAAVQIETGPPEQRVRRALADHARSFTT
jgi:hypothetical protein